jgi:hypothetical protein
MVQTMRQAQVAQLVEHATENRSVGGSTPSLGTISFQRVEWFTRERPFVSFDTGFDSLNGRSAE